ncbi:MAG: NYN domain-containing protein [Verrucomicrobiales bacterium]|nr:NYN domain-containing protein [Verrucomicrobiales bacterium]MBP9225601.1 NYN domain-containing protein [Verrucomicrobiales bacterium]
MAARDEQSRPSFLLIDGNNIIHHSADLLRLHRRNRAGAYAELVRQVAEFRDFSGQRVVLVFDGRGGTVEERPSPGLQVIYTGDDRTADDVLERLALRYTAEFSIVVATDDRTIQDVVIAGGAEVISADALLQRIAAIHQERDRWLRNHRRGN